MSADAPTWRHTLWWRHNGHDSVSNHQTHDCLLNRLFRRRSKKTPKLCATGLCVENSPGTSEFPAQMASNAENVSIWWHHHDKTDMYIYEGCFQHLIKFFMLHQSIKYKFISFNINLCLTLSVHNICDWCSSNSLVPNMWATLSYIICQAHMSLVYCRHILTLCLLC